MSQLKLSSGSYLLDRYEVIKFIAAGGMQEVYLAKDHALQRPVVLKTPKSSIKDRRFKRGAEMGARMHHPNVAATFDYYEDEKITFMVEEFINGKDLGKRLESEFFYFDPALTAHILSHISKALLQAHEANICHRDLKPSNIMVSNDPSFSNIKLTDFGISKLAENEIAAEIEMFEKDENTLTQSNTLLGAVPYMAPECWSNWKGAGKPIDIWAFGCIGYQLLHGQTPFGNGRGAIAKVAIAEASGMLELQKPSWFGKHPNTIALENDLWEIIVACIQIKPENRITAETLVDRCSKLSYPSDQRLVGQIQSYPTRYQSGGVGTFGFITSNSDDVDRWFFHLSDFYGPNAPKAGDRVCFCSYAGDPYYRASPVLVIK